MLLTIPVPRAALVVVSPPPELLSQRNVEQVTGIAPDAYLRMLRAGDFDCMIMAEGKLRLVERVAFLAWLKKHRRAPARSRAADPAPANDGGSGDAADAFLRANGARRKGKR